VRQPGLADSGFAAEQDEPPVAPVRRQQGILEPRQLLLSADEDGGEDSAGDASIVPSMTLLADVVATSAAVTATSSRSEKVAILAELLRRLEPGEVPVAVGFLAGAPRQGRVGVGYATVYGAGREPAAAPSLTVAELDRTITELQASTGGGSAARRKQLLGELFGRATEDEAAFVKRLFTGELRQGALAGVMIDAVAKAAGISGELARRALMLSGDLTRTAEIALSDGEEGLREVGLELFRPILPMLASTAESVAEAVESFECASVEWKLDGIRIQVHRRDDEVRIYTRNLNDLTSALPGIAEAVRGLPVRQAVFDGEALWMGEDGPAAFQDTVSQLDSAAPPEGIVTFLFDLLHADGEDLLDAPLSERSARLEVIAPGLRIPSRLTTDPDEAERVLEESLAAGHEGVVVKDASSPYAAGRRGKAWRKVKPVRTYDLVVLGAEWGHGRRQGWLSNLHLAARDPRTGDFVMVGKTFKGMTDELLDWQTKELLARETSRQGIAVFVRPELVVEIALDGVQSSTRYPGGVALRFARVKGYRPDKSADEADTIDDLRALLVRR
jgi:ATP-dependent DNA ligase I